MNVLEWDIVKDDVVGVGSPLIQVIHIPEEYVTPQRSGP